MSPEQLADDLRRKGKKDVRVERHQKPTGTAAAGLAAASAPSDCSAGYARTFTCPVSYWPNNGFDDPLVRFNDHTGVNWPVTNAVYKWNQVPNIDSKYLYNSCPFQAGARCVDVYNGNYASETWTGRWSALYPTATQSGPYLENGQYIQLNTFS